MYHYRKQRRLQFISEQGNEKLDAGQIFAELVSLSHFNPITLPSLWNQPLIIQLSNQVGGPRI